MSVVLDSSQLPNFNHVYLSVNFLSQFPKLNKEILNKFVSKFSKWILALFACIVICFLVTYDQLYNTTIVILSITSEFFVRPKHVDFENLKSFGKIFRVIVFFHFLCVT